MAMEKPVGVVKQRMGIFVSAEKVVFRLER